MKLLIAINVIDEARLRDVAATRMAQSGHTFEPELNRASPLPDLAFEALYGSNPDPVSPNQYGVTINGWRDAGSFADVIKLEIDADIWSEDLLRREAFARMQRSGFGESDADLLSEPLGELLYQTLIGSNPDPLPIIDMGIEIGSWSYPWASPTQKLEEALS